MNNIKDFLNESILDDVDSKIDNGSELDDAATNLLLDKLLRVTGVDRYGINFNWDKTTKTFKILSKDFVLGLAFFKGKTYITSPLGSERCPFDVFAKSGIKFDCDLEIQIDCIKHGLKLSQCNIVGTGHTLTLFGDGCMHDLSNFVDISPSRTFKTLDIPFGFIDIQRSSKAISKFKCCLFKRHNLLKCYISFEEIIDNIKDLRCKIIDIKGLGRYPVFANNRQANSIADILELEKTQTTKDQKPGYTVNDVCKCLVEQNPKAKILVGLGKDTTQIWEDGGKLKYAKTR